MIIKVTEEHIKNGTHLNPFACPISLALQDAGFKDASVIYSRVSSGTGAFKAFITPKKVVAFMHKFDSLKPVKPFSFRAAKP